MPKSVAITRAVSGALGACELTHLERVAIDVELARAQHRTYEGAVVFDELAILTRPGAESRRRESAAVAEALAAYRPVQVIQPPGTIDGGDVLVAGRRVFVGRSSRTNEAAVGQMRQWLAPLGYTVTETVVRSCLHLKSAVTVLTDGALIVNPEWIDPEVFEGFTLVEVDPSERSAANALRLHDRIVVSSAHPRTAERIAGLGLRVHPVDASEVAKAEGAVTCCSLIVAGR
jgi:dimethylargininase